MLTTDTARAAKGSPFGRVPSLTVQIQRLIHDYPEGIGIIKELAQNADDASSYFQLPTDRVVYIGTQVSV